MNGITSLQQSGFDIEAAVLLAQCSQVAYETDLDFLMQRARRLGFEGATAFDRGNTQGFWTTADDVALLVFRGTNNLGQWVRNARVLPAGHAWGLVHRGFLEGIEQVEQDLRAFDQAARQAQHVWVTGHSLGGALGLLAAARLRQQGISAHIYTYGQPRVGLDNFADRFEDELPERLCRFINQSDIVPRLPPGLFYRHNGNVKRIVRPGELELLAADVATPPELAETDLPPLTDDEYEALLERLEDNPAAELLDSGLLEGVTDVFSDHAIADYVRLLTEIRDQ